MAISFCDIDLLLHDPDGTLQGYLDQYLALHEMEWFGAETPARTAMQQISRQRHPARAAMPRFNWPARPRPQINSLWVPITGATRWSVGLFLIDRKNYRQIADALDSSSSGKLKLTDTRSGGKGKTATKTATMYALTARTISAGDTGLVLLPLVDVRYFWQFADAGTISVAPGSAWSTLLDSLGGALPQSQLDYAAPGANYFKPDALEFQRAYDNAAMLMDAAAASIGCRPRWDLWAGKLKLETNNDAESTYSGIDEGQFDLVAGGNATGSQFNGEVPKKITVLFGEHVGHLPAGNGGLYAKSTSPTKAEADTPTGTDWNVFSTAAADLTGLAIAADPNNQTDLDNLAGQLAGDLYSWQQRQYDRSVAGLYPFDPNGYEDFHWIKMGSLGPSGYQCHTRIATLPQDVYPSTNWCQITAGESEPNPRVQELWPGPRLRVMLQGDLTPGNSVDCYPFTWDGSALAIPGGSTTPDTSKTVSVLDRNKNLRALGKDTLGSSNDGAIGEAEWKPDAKRWEFVSLQALAKLIKVTAPADVAASASFSVTTCTVLDDGQNPCTGGRSQTITNWSLKLCSGQTATAVADGSGGYYVIDAECPSC